MGENWYPILSDVYYNCKIKYDGAYPYVYALRYRQKSGGPVSASVFALPTKEAAPVREGYTLLGFTTVEGGTTPEIGFDDYEYKVFDGCGRIIMEDQIEYLYAVWQKNAE